MEILEAATKSFTLFGYKATTVEQVAKIANVGKGTVYNFFENKQQLLQFVVKNLIDEMRNEADKTLNPDDSFMKNAHNGLMKMLQFRDRHLLFAKLIEEERQLATPEVRLMLGEIEDEIVSYVANRIQIGIEKDEIIDCDPKQVAYLLLKAYKAFIVDWQATYGEAMHEKEILNLFKVTIFKGLAKKSAEVQ
jgi:AcrR family transcriptional regulator